MMPIKLNNKGLSIMELVIAVGLISIVIIFLYRLLIDLNNDFTSNDFAINNQSIRLEIIEEVQADFLKSDISNIKTNNNIITFTFTDETTSKLEIESNSIITYTNSEDVKTTWEMNNCVLETNLNVIEISLETIEGSSNKQIVMINIPVYTANDNNNEDNNNIADDLSFTHVNSSIITIS